MSSTLQAVKISPLTPSFGARVDGLNARDPLDDDVVDQLSKAILEYKVLFLTGQHLDEDQHARLASYFGAPLIRFQRVAEPTSLIETVLPLTPDSKSAVCTPVTAGGVPCFGQNLIVSPT